MICAQFVVSLGNYLGKLDAFKRSLGYMTCPIQLNNGIQVYICVGVRRCYVPENVNCLYLVVGFG